MRYSHPTAMKLLLQFILAFAYSLTVFADSTTEADARDWCDKNILSPVEGIWEYPEDGARVVIQSDDAIPGSFTLTILSTPDCRLEPGDVIARLYQSVDAKQFRLSQSTRKNKSILSLFCDCVATLSDDGETLRVKSPKIKFKISLHTLLPRFWRGVRLSIDNPEDELPAGLIKIYPGYDHNGSTKRKKRVL